MPNLFHVSARDHGALILMTALAEAHATESYLSLQEIADRMRLSQGYLEEIARSLKTAGLIQGKQGPSGGYRLAKDPQAITLEAILVALEGPVELVDCQSSATGCPVSDRCVSKNVWNRLQETLQKTLREMTLAEAI